MAATCSIILLSTARTQWQHTSSCKCIFVPHAELGALPEVVSRSALSLCAERPVPQAGLLSLICPRTDARIGITSTVSIERRRLGIRIRPYHFRRASRSSVHSILDAPSPHSVPPLPSLVPSVPALNRKRLTDKQRSRPASFFPVRCSKHHNRDFVISEFCHKCDQAAIHASPTSNSDDVMKEDGLVSPENQFWGDPVGSHGSVSNNVFHHDIMRSDEPKRTGTGIQFPWPSSRDEGNCGPLVMSCVLRRDRRLPNFVLSATIHDLFA